MRCFIAALLAVTFTACNKPVAEAPSLKLSVQSQPDGATVVIDGVESGQTPWNGKVDTGGHFVEVRMTSYDSAYVRIPKDKSGSDEISVTLKRQAAPVQVDSTPVGATVEVDGKSIGKTPLFIAQQPIGSYEVKLSAAGFAAKTLKLDITDPRPRHLAADLGSVLGGLVIYAPESGVSILMDDKLQGTIESSSRPLRLRDMPEGTYSLVARHPEFHEQTQTVVITRNEEKTVRFPAMRELSGGVVIASVPEGAKVFHNDELVGTTPCELKDLERGRMTFEFRMDGFDPVQQSVEISPGKIKQISAQMSKNVGSIAFATKPAGCTIFLDKAKVGVSAPSANELVSKIFTIDGLTSGPHQIVLEHPTHFSFKKTILVQRGEVVRLGTIALPQRWIPDHVLKVRNSGKVVEGRLLARRQDGSITFEHEKGVKVDYQAGEVEYLRPLEN
jgi:hypothetical protein